MKNEPLISRSARVSRFLGIIALVLVFVSPAFAADEKKIDAPADSFEAADIATSVMASPKIAVVDVQMLVAQSKAGKSINEQIEKQRNTYREQISKQEQTLRQAEKDLMAQRATLSKEDMAKKGKAFQEKVMAAQRDVQKRRVAFDKAYTTAMEKLREHIVKIVAEIASKNSINLVLNRQEVVLVDAKMDLTKRVLTALDEKVTSIAVDIK